MTAAEEEEWIHRSARLAAQLAEAGGGSSGTDRRQRRFRRLLDSPGGTALVFALADRVLRPNDAAVAADQFRLVVSSPLEGLSVADRVLLRSGAAAAERAPGLVMRLVSARFRHETAGLIYPAARYRLGRRLGKLEATRRRPNVNILGEAVLGEHEAARRARAVERLLRRHDVHTVSVKASALSPNPSLLDFDGSLGRAAEPLRSILRQANRARPPKLVHLDMEEHRDLDLTVELFMRVLGEPEFSNLTAGIALQAYLPDSHAALDRILAWSAERVQAGGAPARVRLVKGANLAMELIDAELRGWPLAPYGTKAQTDASYKAMLDKLLAAPAGSVRIGVATHNLFDTAWALLRAEDSGSVVEVEMLAGMADQQVDAVTARGQPVLLYVPITQARHYRTAMAYLARRLDENATPEGFLRNSLGLAPRGPRWEEQARRFGDAVRARHRVNLRPHQCQRRSTETQADHLEVSAEDRFVNEPDTDLSVADNRRWALSVLAGPRPEVPPTADVDDVERAVAIAAGALDDWGRLPTRQRQQLCERAAAVMAAERAVAVGIMASETGKTFAEADPEVSEAVDFARWYGRQVSVLDSLLHAGQADGPGGAVAAVVSSALGVVVVSPPWNFPYAIAAGGVLAALAAGNTVILKPAPEARAVSALLIQQLHRAGFPTEVAQLVAAADDDAGRRLIEHPGVAGVILTGSADTAGHFARWNPARRLLGETSGKNAMVVTATADVDQAVRDLVRSAFGHSGQKCSAASLAIVDQRLLRRSAFLRQLADATRSLRVGPASEPATEVGPVVGPFTPALERALTTLDEGEEWLVTPRRLSERLWSPGVRTGVRPGSWAHRTEWFGPVLAVMAADGLDQAIAWQNDVDYGLTAGLQSLDPREHLLWAGAVQAGNLYINKPTTGAIVGRQPFGGWKRSSYGPTAKAGGPNYLLGLRRWRDSGTGRAEDARASYGYWMDTYFSRSTELAGLAGESNELRYVSYQPGVCVRTHGRVDPEQLRRAVWAAEACGTGLSFSSSDPLDNPADQISYQESPEALVSRLTGRGPAAASDSADLPRLRLLGSPEPEVLEAAADAGLSVLDEPICGNGRVELVRWMREQSISRSLHRYGSVVYPRLDWATAARPAVDHPEG